MALLHLVSLSLPCTTLPSKILPKQFHKTKASSSSSSLSIQYTKPNNINISTLPSPIVRRSADFKPTVWHYDLIQSLGSKYMEESNAEKWQVLKEEVRMMLCKKKEEEEPLHQLEFIDVLQRLGVAYHFETEIKNILENHYININKMDKLLKGEKDLHTTSLEFRLLRQHGYHLSIEVFDRFLDEMGNFKQIMSADIKGMLSLYEASFLEVENESILKKAREFSREILKEYYVRKEKENDFMSLLINHALEVPLHWRMQRWEALWFINAYERSPNVIPPLLQLAKLDFNMLQAIYQEELKHTSRWWKGIGLMENLSFARDRLVEGFVWAVGYNYMPQNAKLREVITKVLALITTMDDIYDVYGTLEELELFTQAVDRWDINAIDNLPHYMKIYFLALFNFVNELAFDVLKEEGCHMVSYLKKVWAELSKAYLIEAKWYYSGYKPKLQEYMENAWISMGPNVVLVHAYFCVQHPIRKEDLDRFEEHPLLCRYSGIIFRLADDLETFKDEMKRGDVPKAIECYMNEYEGSEEDGREHIKSMMDETWKKMNEEIIEKCSFSESFKEIAVNLGRTAQWCYQYGDGFGVEDHLTNSRISSLLVNPIP